MRISRRLGLYAGAEGGGITLPTYTGSYAIFGDAVQGYIELYTSGTLSLAKANYQVFAVGGGGGGAPPYDDGEGNTTYGGGGAGGYTTTATLNLAANTSYTVTIGAGGDAHANGGTTSVGNNITAQGGKKGYVENAAQRYDSCGGCGGGEAGTSSSNRHAGKGGSDGEGGYTCGYNTHTEITTGDYYRGQGTTTRAFGEAEGTLYAGGGGGGGFPASSPGAGGDGGSGGGGHGGRGLKSQNGCTAGTANTGGGGGGQGWPAFTGKEGGSGIVIVRWGFAA